jgi:hypothetical protein
MTEKALRCIDFESLFLDSFHGNLPQEKEGLLENHLRECPECREEFDRQMELFKVLDTGRAEPELSEDFWDGYWDRLQEKAGENFNHPSSTPTAGFLPRRIWYSAAAVLLVILGLVAGRYWFPASVTPPASIAAGNDSIYPVVQQHFETLRPILIDYSNQEGEEAMSDTDILRTLLLQNRLLKRMASRSRNTALMGLLEDLEIVIIEMLNGNGDGGDNSGVGQMIQDNDLLFKMKIYKRKSQNIRQIPI